MIFAGCGKKGLFGELSGTFSETADVSIVQFPLMHKDVKAVSAEIGPALAGMRAFSYMVAILETIMFKSSLKKLGFSISAAFMAAAAAPGSAVAITLPGPYAVFEHCPYNNPDVAEFGSCVYNVTNSGSFKIGSTTLPIDSPIVLQGGIQWLDASPLYDAVGAPTLSAAPAQVPGGLLGIVNPAPDWPFPLWVAFWNIVNSVNGVTATIEPVATIQTNFLNVAFPPGPGVDATAARLAVRVHLQNPFLGNTCYIGSVQKPIVINLTAGITSPPPPNQPISGSSGTYTEVVTDPDAGYGYTTMTGSTLVDNAFAVPGASGCGNVALGLPILTPLLDFLVSGAVNLKVGLPSAAGKNTAIMNGDTELAGAFIIAALASP